jgi:aminoglycoside phosphotransferase (APT) family kinase protein
MQVDRQTLYSGTEAPAGSPHLDRSRLADYLAQHLSGLGRHFTIEKFKGGQSNPTYKLTNDSVCVVLRRKPPGVLLPSAHAIDREYRVMAALLRARFPVPTPYCYCADTSVIGSEFYVASFEAGRIYWNAELPDIDPPERSAIYNDLARRLAQLHSYDPTSLGLGDFGPQQGYVARNFARWAKVYEQSRLAHIPDMEWLLANLPTLMPAEEPVRLIHGDYGLYNLVVSQSQPAIQAVLDWEMSTLGNPWVDLAHHLRPWWEPPNARGAATSLCEFDLGVLGIPTLDAYAKRYCLQAGFAEWPNRNFYLGFAQFRYGAMIQGILKRAAIGTAASHSILHTQERVFAVAALARNTLLRGID